MTAAPIGLICGGGDLPLQAADAIARTGRNVFLVGLTGAASEGIARFPHGWMKLGEIGRLFRLLDGAGVRDLAIVGAVRRPALADLKFDLAALTSLPELRRLFGGGDDRLLRGVVAFLEGRGYRVRGVHELADELTAPPGALGRRRPSAADETDIDVGLALLEALDPFDVGQAVVVAEGRVIAVEAAEGTDRMLRRVAKLNEGRAGRAGVLVKTPKPSQDLRVDLPAIGAVTVALAAEAGLGGVAVAAGRVLIADRSASAAAADAAGLFLFGVAGRDRPPAA